MSTWASKFIAEQRELGKTGDAYLDENQIAELEALMLSERFVIAFQPDAWEGATTMLYRLEDWTVDVFPTEGDQFTARVGNVNFPDGEPTVDLNVVVDGNPTGETRTLRIYADIARLEVL